MEVQINFSEKYASKNPISQKLISGFKKSLATLLTDITFNELLDVGCGEGVMLYNMQTILKKKICNAIDLEEKNINDAKINFPNCNYKVNSIYHIDYPENSMELVTCLEVLEHLDNPELGLKELHRVTQKHAILSVPREPIWRLMNMARFKYWSGLGNTPDHLNHWSTKSFIKFISPYFKVEKVLQPLPWTMVLCTKKH